MTTRRVDVSSQAARDIRDVTLAGRRMFGHQAAIRYRALIAAAIERLREDPAQRTSTAGKAISGSVFLFHLRHVRQSGPEIIHNPRHLIAYTFDEDVLRIQRLLHDAMDLPKHLPAAS